MADLAQSIPLRPMCNIGSRVCVLVSLAGLACASLSPHGAHASPLPLTPVAISGQQAPGFAAGVTYKTFDQARVGWAASGAPLVFWAEVQGPGVTAVNNRAIFTDRTGAIEPLVVVGDAAPWYTETTFNALPEFAIGRSGSVALLGIVADTGLPPNSSLEAKNAGVYTEPAPGTLEPLAREGESIGGVPGTLWNNMTVPQIATESSISDSVAFWSGLPASIWSTRSGVLELAHATGDSLPGMLPGETATHLGIPVQGATGALVFAAQRVTDDPRIPVGSGLWVDRRGTGGGGGGGGWEVDLLAMTGMPGPVIGSVYTDVASRGSINARGEVLFHATLDDAGMVRQAILLDVATTQTIVAMQDDPVPPISGASFQRLSRNVSVNDCGHVAFHASFVGPGIDANNNSAVFRRMSDGVLTALVREGDPVPDMPDFLITSLGDPMLMASGAVVVSAHAQRPAFKNSGRELLLAIDNANVAHLIAMTKESIEVAPDDVRTVDSISWDAGQISSGTTSANPDGTLALSLRFTDGSYGLFTTHIAAQGDLNADGLVDILDLLDFLQAFDVCDGQPMPCPSEGPDIDLNADGVVDVLDFLRFLEIFSGAC